jgi:hypothetical protein
VPYRAIVDARNTEGEELDGDGSDHLVVGGRVARKAKLGTEDVIVVVADGDVFGPEMAVRAHDRGAGIEPVEVGARRGEPFGHVDQRESRLADVERGVELRLQHVEVAVFRRVASRHFPDEEEVVFAEIGGELLERPAKSARLRQRDVFQRVEAKAVDVRERDPVLETSRQIVEQSGVVEVEIAQREKVAALVLRVGIVDVPRFQTPRAGAGVAIRIMQLRGPHAVVARADAFDGLAVAAAPRAERVTSVGVGRLVDAARRAFGVKPIAAGMLEHDVEQNAHFALVRLVDEKRQVVPVAEARIDVEKVLDRVAVVAVLVSALLEDGAQPQRRRAERLEIVELGDDAAQGAPLKAGAARFGPGSPVPYAGARGGEGTSIEQGALDFAAVAETVDEEEVEDLVLPIDGRGVILGAPREHDVPNSRRDRRFQQRGSLRCHEITRGVHRHGCRTPRLAPTSSTRSPPENRGTSWA